LILGQAIRMLTVPVRPGRDMGSILEIAARNELLRRAGKDSARSFIERVEASLHRGVPRQVVEPESMASPVEDLIAITHRSPPPEGKLGSEAPRQQWVPANPGAHSLTESSAWIPAVRPKKEDE
jgi:HPr kinase/phosphorylase